MRMMIAIGVAVVDENTFGQLWSIDGDLTGDIIMTYSLDTV
jgi:hypothetical protein